MNDINYALVEEKRPAMYTAMKYWGKKPHNIWNAYIQNYTPKNGIVLDPFAGSAISAFEAVKAGKKAIAFDLNPLTSFIIEVYSTEFDIEKFRNSVNRICNKIVSDEVYREYFTVRCPNCGYEYANFQNFKWENGDLYECGIVCPYCKEKHLMSPTKKEVTKAVNMEKINIPFWFPNDLFYDSPSFSDSFRKNIGNSFDKLWTRRNLYVLSFIFNEILTENNNDIKLQLLFGFIQSLHLSSKMCVPRRANANRAYSTSWGRAAYIYSKRQMEMNPLLLFENNCLGKQSVESALRNVKEHVGKTPKTKYVTNYHDINLSDKYDIFYGIVDIKSLNDFLPKESISFIITDPPYGGLVQYIDLSYIWLVWLKKYDNKYMPNIDQEITVKKGQKSIDEYNKDFTKGIKNLYYVLKNDGKIVFTFHNKDLMVWNAFLRSISEAGFQIEKVIHQQNKRTGESNVANPYGTSASDFYIRCSKSQIVKKVKTTRDQFENFVVDRAINIIKARNEPTPYQILFNGLLSEISKAGFVLENFDDNIHELLEKHTEDIFDITKAESNIGNLWWIKGYKSKSTNVLPLSQRVDQTIKDLFDKNTELTIDDVLAEIFIKYPNGLTPDIRNIEKYISKYAYKSGNKWVRK